MVPLHDFHVIAAKELLKTAGQGYVVEAIENHYDIHNYRTSFKDSTLFSRAYLEDLAECMNVATEQNVRILADNDLGDCLKA